MTKLRVQQYMEKHKLTPLFEDLMNRVLHEQPDDPIVYLIKCLYKKAAIPVPKDLKSSPVRKSSPERLARRSKSPDKGAAQAWAVASGPDLVDRSYEKPWLKHSKKVKSKDEERSESRQGKKQQQKTGWVSDTKVTATSFDELFEEDPHKTEPGTRHVDQGGTRSRKDEGTDITRAWARHVSLDDSEDPNYRSRGYSGPRCHRNDDDPLAGEIMLAKEESTVESAVSTSKPKGAKLGAERHRQDLEKILQESDKVSLDSGFDGARDEEEDEAIELLEDPEDLLREGVTNIPKSGYKLSKILRHRQEEANVKLNINLFTGTRLPDSADGNQYGDYYESDLERPPTGMSYQSNKYSQLSPDVSDEEFESVSQVVGPRHPVWSVPDSDGETYRVEPSRKSTQGKFSSTAPVRFDDKPPFPRRSVDTENIFLDGSKTWTSGQERTGMEKEDVYSELSDDEMYFDINVAVNKDKESIDEQHVHEHEIHGSHKEQQVNQSEIQPSNQGQHVNDQENQASDERVNEHETCASNVEQHINEYKKQANNEVQHMNENEIHALNKEQHINEHKIKASNEVQLVDANEKQASNEGECVKEHENEIQGQNVNDNEIRTSNDGQHGNKHEKQTKNKGQHLNEHEIQDSSGVQNVSEINGQLHKDAQHQIDQETRVNFVYTSSSDDDIPLSKLLEDNYKGKERKSVRRKLIDTHIEYSDDCKQDISYDPQKDILNSTDSETEEFRKIKQRKRRQKKRKQITCCRNKSWKKKASTFKSKSKKLVNKRKKESPLHEKLRRSIKLLNERRKKSRNLQTHDEFKKTVQRSKTLASLKARLNRLHEARLDQLLAANERKRVQIPADGNCFFAAVAESVDNNLCKDVDTFRNSLCDHIQQNKDIYLPFLTSISESENQSDVFERDISTMRRNGHWDATLADCMPLAVANYFNCEVRIYSSSTSTPFINVKPSNWEQDGHYKRIEIAYIAFRNNEHYDATKPVIIQPGNTELPPDNTTRDNSMEHCGNENHIPVTPHKRADNNSPKQKLSSRKRKRNEKEWQSSVRKRNKLQGKSYKSKSGKTVKGKGVKPSDCSKCRFKCNSNFTETERQHIFEMYYALPTYERQRCFICDVVSKSDPVRSTKSKRKVSLKYSFFKGEESIRVCRKFVLKTLDIGEKLIRYTLKRKTHGTFRGTDLRGRHTPSTKINDARVKLVYEHIKSFPTMESHYARKSSKKQYLAHDLSIKRMWQLYKDWQQYIRHKSEDTLTADLQKEYEIHQQQKVEAREEKAKDKEKAKTDQTYFVATFDLQAVLTTPCSLVSELYYSRKLCCYNLTVYNLADRHVLCHLWDETHGKRGSCEIATCLLKTTESYCLSGATEVTYYSDTCGGKNRNRFVAAAYLCMIAKQPQLKAINHKFLQSGHSQMECDAVHSTIEHAKKKTSIYVPSQWSTVINMARKSNPYVAVPLKFGHVLNFKAFVSKYKLNLQKTSDGKLIKWLNVRWIRVTKQNPTQILVNYTFDEKEFQTVDTMQTSTRNKGRPKTLPQNDTEIGMCYNSRLEISVQKKTDLVNLCTKDIIPEEFHSYIASIPTNKTNKDFLPENSEYEAEEY